MFIPAGLFLVVAGLAKFVYDVTKSNLSESTVLLLLGALIIWAIGLLADQNSHLMRHR